MSFLLLFPTVLSVLIFCAHLFRNGFALLIPPVLISLGLLFFRSGAVARIYQLFLLFIAGQWALTAFNIGMRRADAGESWLRMALILGAVGAFALFSAALFESPTLLRRYPRRLLSPPPDETAGEGAE